MIGHENAAPVEYDIMTPVLHYFLTLYPCLSPWTPLSYITIDWRIRMEIIVPVLVKGRN